MDGPQGGYSEQTGIVAGKILHAARLGDFSKSI